MQRDGAGKKVTCPKAHSSWSFVANLPAEGPNPRRQHTKGGFTTKRDVEQALRAFLATVDQGQAVLPTKVTFEQHIDGWLEAVEPSLSATNVSNYRIIVRCYLRPQRGAYRLTSLRPDRFIKAYRPCSQRVARGAGLCRRRPSEPLTASCPRR